MKIGFLQEHNRKILGAGILLLALVGAIGLASQANSSVSMWGAKYSLSPGASITQNDLEKVKVSLGDQAPQYFSSKAKLIGSFVTKSISPGELIPVSAITRSANIGTKKEIPVGVNRSDLPSNVRIGDLVDLYSIPIKDPKAVTALITTKARVAAIDMQSQNLGGVVNILLSVEKDVLLDITDAIQMGRIVVVRNEI